jgi:hypothetical protein
MHAPGLNPPRKIPQPSRQIFFIFFLKKKKNTKTANDKSTPPPANPSKARRAKKETINRHQLGADQAERQAGRQGVLLDPRCRAVISYYLHK